MQLKVNINEEAAHDLVDVLQGVNDIVRIVDPETREVLFWPTVGAADIMSGSPCAPEVSTDATKTDAAPASPMVRVKCFI